MLEVANISMLTTFLFKFWKLLVQDFGSISIQNFGNTYIQDFDNISVHKFDSMLYSSSSAFHR